MRTLKLYGGVFLLIITVAILAVSFFTGLLQDADMNHIILGISLVLALASIILVVLGGKSADKIGGK